MGLKELMKPSRQIPIFSRLFYEWPKFDNHIIKQADHRMHGKARGKPSIATSRGNVDNPHRFTSNQIITYTQVALSGNLITKEDVDYSTNVQAEIHNIQNLISTYQVSSHQAIVKNQMNKVMKKRYGSSSSLFETDCDLYKEQLKEQIQEIERIHQQFLDISNEMHHDLVILNDWYSGRALIVNRTNE